MAARGRLSRWLPPAARRWLLRGVGAVLLLCLPFWLLVRGCLWLAVDRGWPPGLALVGAAALATVAVAASTCWLGARIVPRPRGRWRGWRVAVTLAACAVIVFAGHSLVVLSELHAKGPAERAEYSELHPTLRLAIGSLRILDDRVLVTDVARRVEDYAGMGLPAPSRSLHIEQSDGFVHAIDLRTLGRGAIHNALLRLYFEAMGFDTRRHVGTADHLHVELPSRRLAG